MTNLPVKFGVGSIAMLLCYKGIHKTKLWRIIKEELIEIKKRTKPAIRVLLCFSIVLLLIIALSDQNPDIVTCAGPTPFQELSYSRRLGTIKCICDSTAYAYEQIDLNHLNQLFIEERISEQTLDYMVSLTNRYNQKLCWKIFFLLLNPKKTGWKTLNGFFYFLRKTLKRLGLRKADLTQDEILYIYTQYIWRYYGKTSKTVRR